VIIKRSTSEHLEGWVRLRQCLWPDETADEHRHYATSLLNRPEDAIGYLACDGDGSTVAFVEATVRRDYVNGCESSPVGFLEGLYVEPHYRKRGLARRLCSLVEGWAKDMGCTEFASDVLLQNEAGQKVHKALGFIESERVVFFVKQI
jgi:aminoglycoside 6'-N-acetyltransferase I